MVEKNIKQREFKESFCYLFATEIEYALYARGYIDTYYGALSAISTGVLIYPEHLRTLKYWLLKTISDFLLSSSFFANYLSTAFIPRR